MYPNVSLAEEMALVAGFTKTVADTQVNTAVIDISKFNQLLFVFGLGGMAAETIDCGVETCDSDGNNAVDITGKQATQLAADADANDNKWVKIAVKSTDLIANGKQHVRGTMVTGGATGGQATCVVLGSCRYGPGMANDLASVVQVIK